MRCFRDETGNRHRAAPDVSQLFSTFHDAVSASALLGLLLISHHLELLQMFLSFFLLFMMLCLLQPYLASSSSPIILNLFTFFSLGILKVPWDSLVSISRLWISMSLF